MAYFVLSVSTDCGLVLVLTWIVHGHKHSNTSNGRVLSQKQPLFATSRVAPVFLIEIAKSTTREGLTVLQVERPMRIPTAYYLIPLKLFTVNTINLNGQDKHNLQMDPSTGIPSRL